MSKSDKKIFLVHGESDYYIFKHLRELKRKVQNENINYVEFWGAKSLGFNDIYTNLQSNDLFMTSTMVIIRDLTDNKSFFPFVEKLTDFLNSKEEFQNEAYLFNYGKVLKTSKLYKAISKIGEVIEYSNPKPEETLKDISKSLSIDKDAAQLLYKYTNGSLFSIKNEVTKLKTFLLASGSKKIQSADIERLSVRNFSQDDVWGIGSSLMYCVIENNTTNQKRLLSQIDDCLKNDIATMQILYSFYQNIINAIKLKNMVNKHKSFRECMSIGYFFVKEFYEKRNSLDLEKLYSINSKLLEYEYAVKTGNTNEVLGLKNLILSL
jgi:DNA polymerase III delta subunit